MPIKFEKMMNKLLYLLVTAVFGSFAVMAQPGKSGKVDTEGKSNVLNITSYGSFRSWYKVADPLGKTISLFFEKPIRRVTINGHDWREWDAKKEFVVIPQTTKNLQVTISY